MAANYTKTGNGQLAKTKEADLKRKIRIEKQDGIRIKKELERIKRDEQKL